MEDKPMTLPSILNEIMKESGRKYGAHYFIADPSLGYLKGYKDGWQEDEPELQLIHSIHYMMGYQDGRGDLIEYGLVT
jgi:hypothetical protein